MLRFIKDQCFSPCLFKCSHYLGCRDNHRNHEQAGNLSRISQPSSYPPKGSRSYRCCLLNRTNREVCPLFFITFVKTYAMQILQTAITRAELAALAENTFGDMIKSVADVKRGLLALDAELHADLERLLLENGSAGEERRERISSSTTRSSTSAPGRAILPVGFPTLRQGKRLKIL